MWFVQHISKLRYEDNRQDNRPFRPVDSPWWKPPRNSPLMVWLGTCARSSECRYFCRNSSIAVGCVEFPGKLFFYITSKDFCPHGLPGFCVCHQEVPKALPRWCWWEPLQCLPPSPYWDQTRNSPVGRWAQLSSHNQAAPRRNDNDGSRWSAWDRYPCRYAWHDQDARSILRPHDQNIYSSLDKDMPLLCHEWHTRPFPAAHLLTA